MLRIPPSPPQILPHPEKEHRPLWSVMIPVYNCSEYLAEAIESVLSQSIPTAEMQIEVVDDASTDADIESIVCSIGKGRVSYYRQPQNVGSLRNFETCINRAKGKLIHILHGDDKVISGYYKTIQNLFDSFPEAGAAFCRYQTIDEAGNVIKNDFPLQMPHNGLLSEWLLRISKRNYIQYAAITVKREVYERLGSFYGLTYGEDWEMWVRIAKYYPVAYTPSILAEYRKHTSSISGNKIVTGDYLKDFECVFQLIQSHLPAESREVVLRAARRYYALYGISIANLLWTKYHNRRYVVTNLKEALKMCSDALICYRSAKLVLKMLLNKT